MYILLELVKLSGREGEIGFIVHVLPFKYNCYCSPGVPAEDCRDK